MLRDISEAGASIACRRLSSEPHGHNAIPVSLELTLPPPDGGKHTIAGEVVRTEHSRAEPHRRMRFRQRYCELTTRLATFLCLDDPVP